MLNDLEIKFERVSAIDGRDPNIWQHSNIFKTVLYFNLALPTRGTIACFLSHRLVWGEMIRRNLKQAIVFEDDVVPVNFDPAILNIDLSSMGLDQLRLEEWEDWIDPGRLPIQRSSVPLLGRQAVVTPTAGTGCYILTLSGAEKLYRAKKFWFTVDHFDVWQRLFGVKTAVLRPTMFTQTDSSSDIEPDSVPTELLPTILKEFVAGPRPTFKEGARRLKRWVRRVTDDVWIFFRGHLGHPPKQAMLYYETTKAERFQKFSALSRADENC
ncbi:MAG: glycosyltransferase family 25 protein [Aestuariivirga sp.]